MSATTERQTWTAGEWIVSKHGTPDYAPQYGIHNGGNDFVIVKGDNAKAYAARIVAAVNACAKIADPERAVPALVEALRKLVHDIDARDQRLGTLTLGTAVDEARAALALAGRE